MKKIGAIISVFLMMLLISCTKMPDFRTFEAEILELNHDFAIVEPVKMSPESQIANRISVSLTNDNTVSELQVGDVVAIIYNGDIREGSPARLADVSSVKVLKRANISTTSDLTDPESEMTVPETSSAPKTTETKPTDLITEPQTDPSDTDATSAPETTSAESTGKTVLSGNFPLNMTFSSGAGAWSTTLVLNQDGSFFGGYHDSDMGDVGKDNPNGKVYFCNFSGQFRDIQQIDENTYSMTMDWISTEAKEGEDYIKDGVLYVASLPHGLDGGEEFFLYTPDKPTEGLSEEFLSWGPYYIQQDPSETLTEWGLYNVAQGCGFFTYNHVLS